MKSIDRWLHRQVVDCKVHNILHSELVPQQIAVIDSLFVAALQITRHRHALTPVMHCGSRRFMGSDHADAIPRASPLLAPPHRSPCTPCDIP